MGVPLTGNGRRENYRCAPMPRMTNTFLDNGAHAPQEIIASVKRGLYATTFTALILMGVLGVVIWEPLYHLGQQFRWEKDWPTLFGLITVIPEAILLWAVLPAYETSPASGWTFLFHIFSTWVLIWLFAIGPIKIFLVRYRFRGGRVL